MQESSVSVRLHHRYALQGIIARGGMGTVWNALDETLGRRVAVKVLHPALAGDDAFRERFRREARAAAALNHPNIVSIYDTGEDRGHHYIVMELVTGPSLAHLLGPSGRLSHTEVVTLLRGVLAALAYAHERGIVHRDVKPANILLAPGAVKVADFGIARAITGSDLTATGAILGTAAYLAPEQAEGRPLDGRADLYALACVAYRALAGQLPWTADTEVGVVLARTLRPPEPLWPRVPGTPRRLVDVIERALERDPAARWPTAASMARALNGLRAAPIALQTRSAPAGTGHPAAAVPSAPARRPPPAPPPRPGPALRPTRDTRVSPLVPTPPPRRPKRKRARAWLAVGVLATMAAAALATGLFVAGPPRPGTSPAPAQPLRIVAASEVDPRDGKEKPALVPLAYDGNLATAWTTDRYKTRQFGNLKTGLGLAFDLGAPLAPHTVTLDVSPGADLELRTASAISDNPDRWQVVRGTHRDDVSEKVVLETGDTASRYWLVWFTLLPPTNRATIAEISFGG